MGLDNVTAKMNLEEKDAISIISQKSFSLPSTIGINLRIKPRLLGH